MADDRGTKEEAGRYYLRDVQELLYGNLLKGAKPGQCAFLEGHFGSWVFEEKEEFKEPEILGFDKNPKGKWSASDEETHFMNNFFGPGTDGTYRRSRNRFLKRRENARRKVQESCASGGTSIVQSMTELQKEWLEERMKIRRQFSSLEFCEAVSSYLDSLRSDPWKKPEFRALFAFIKKQLEQKDLSHYAAALTWLLLGAFFQDEIAGLASMYELKMTEDAMKANCAFTELYRLVVDDEEPYVERPWQMDALKQRFSASDGKRIVYISGMGGEGKSFLARACATEHFEKEPNSVLWLTYIPDRADSFAALLQENGYKAEYAEELKNAGSSFLIVVDDLSSQNKNFLKSLKNDTGDADLLITTRLSSFSIRANDPKAQILSLEGEGEEEKRFCAAVFAKNYEAEPQDAQPKHIEEQEWPFIHRICGRLGYNPQAAALAACEVREYGRQGRSLGEFARKLESGGIAAAHREGAAIYWERSDGYQSFLSMIEILKEIFPEIAAGEKPLSLAEKQIFAFLSLFPGEHLPLAYVCELMGDDEDWGQIDSNCRRMIKMSRLQGSAKQGWVALHPLVKELLFLEKSESLLSDSEKKDFFSHLMRNWIAMDETRQRWEPHLFRRLWERSGIRADMDSKENAVVRYIRGSLPEELREKLLLSRPFSVFACAEMPDKKVYLHYDLRRQKEEVYLCCGRSVWRGPAERTLPEKIGQAKLLYLSYEAGEPEDLILPDVLYGCPVLEIPPWFCTNRKIKNLKLPTYLERIGLGAFFGSSIQNSLCIPEGVTELGATAFGRFRSGQTLTLPAHLHEIPENAFKRSDFAGKLEIPDSVVKIGKSAFEGCRGLSSLRLSENLIVIEDGAFQDCGFAGDLFLPDSVRFIGISAFENCRNLDGALHLPERVDIIEEQAFHRCAGLKGEIKLPASIEVVGWLAFARCPALIPPTEQEVQRLVENGAEIGEAAFDIQRDAEKKDDLWDMWMRLIGVDPAQEHRDEPLLNEFYNDPSLPEELPKRIFTEADAAGLQGEGLYIPENVTEIGPDACKDGVFRGELRLPPSLRRIGQGAFQNCAGLAGELRLPHFSLTSIGSRAFQGCVGFRGNLKLPFGLEEIGERAFQGCVGFEGNLELPHYLEYIGKRAFQGCTGLRGTLTISGDTSIGSEAFADTGFERIIITSEDPSIASDAFENCNAEIVGPAFSAAERFADLHNLPFRLLEEQEDEGTYQ